MHSIIGSAHGIMCIVQMMCAGKSNGMYFSFNKIKTWMEGEKEELIELKKMDENLALNVPYFW